MTEEEMLEAENFWCENCCNFDKEHIGPDGTALCKLTNTLAYCEESGGDCPFFNIPSDQAGVVVRCKDCVKKGIPSRCALWIGTVANKEFFVERGEDFYCSYGEWREIDHEATGGTAASGDDAAKEGGGCGAIS